jgi:hypothetical protein
MKIDMEFYMLEEYAVIVVSNELNFVRLLS